MQRFVFVLVLPWSRVTNADLASNRLLLSQRSDGPASTAKMLLSHNDRSVTYEACDRQESFNTVMCNSFWCRECVMDWCSESCKKLQEHFAGCRCEDWPDTRTSFSDGNFQGRGRYGETNTWDYATTCKESEVIEAQGATYRGFQQISRNGFECQKWNDQSSDYTAVKYPLRGMQQGDHNFCRNPDDDVHGIWCFQVGHDSNGHARGKGYCDPLPCDKRPPTTTEAPEGPQGIQVPR